MQSLNGIQMWRQRHGELLREAEMNRLAKAARSSLKRRYRLFSALGWELQHHSGRLSKRLRTLRYEI